MGAPRAFPIVHNSSLIVPGSMGSGPSMEGCPESVETEQAGCTPRESEQLHSRYYRLMCISSTNNAHLARGATRAMMSVMMNNDDTADTTTKCCC